MRTFTQSARVECATEGMPPRLEWNGLPLNGGRRADPPARTPPLRLKNVGPRAAAVPDWWTTSHGSPRRLVAARDAPPLLALDITHHADASRWRLIRVRGGTVARPRETP